MMITSTFEHNRTPFFHDHVSSLKIMIGSNETLQFFCQIELQETAVMPVSESQPFPEFCGDRGRVLRHVTTLSRLRCVTDRRERRHASLATLHARAINLDTWWLRHTSWWKTFCLFTLYACLVHVYYVVSVTLRVSAPLVTYKKFNRVASCKLGVFRY